MVQAVPEVGGDDLARHMRCSQCGKNAAKIVAVARPRPAVGQHRPIIEHFYRILLTLIQRGLA
jgi:hypothetical protein